MSEANIGKMQAGNTLKWLRATRNLTARDVENACQRLAEAKRNGRFRISNGWLVRLENGTSAPSIYKLFSMSVVYDINLADLIKLYDMDLGEVEKYRLVASPEKTRLLNSESPQAESASRQPSSNAHPLGTKTAVLRDGIDYPAHRLSAEAHEHLVYGYIGLNDLTMYPLIRPGSFVCVDTKQNQCRTTVWRNEYERPIFFIELRNGYICGWCEMNRNNLMVVPHHLSPSTIRQFVHPTEAEIVGRVVSFNSRCVEEPIHEKPQTRTK